MDPIIYHIINSSLFLRRGGTIKDKVKKLWNPDKNRLKFLAVKKKIFLPPKLEVIIFLNSFERNF